MYMPIRPPLRFAVALFVAAAASHPARAFQETKSEAPVTAPAASETAAAPDAAAVPPAAPPASAAVPAVTDGATSPAATSEASKVTLPAPAASTALPGAAVAALPPTAAALPPTAASTTDRGHKKGKAVYTGPNTLVELAPTPMLDEEGKQRIDPDGKPLWNEPVHQQRDKNGHPLFDKDGKPVMQTKDELGYDDKGKKLHAVRVKEPKTVSVAIERGTLTVDGMTGKAGLNYDIHDLKYIYLYAPWLGTAVVSNVSFPGAIEQKKAFVEKTLTVNVDGHTFELYSDKPLLGKKPESAWVLVNRDFTLPTKFPVMGYGMTLKPPYTWPGAKAVEVAEGPTKAPPLPASLRPVQALQPCPAGQMRAAAKPLLPGQTASVSPCVAIAKTALAPGKPAASAVASQSAGSLPEQPQQP